MFTTTCTFSAFTFQSDEETMRPCPRLQMQINSKSQTGNSDKQTIKLCDRAWECKCKTGADQVKKNKPTINQTSQECDTALKSLFVHGKSLGLGIVYGASHVLSHRVSLEDHGVDHGVIQLQSFLWHVTTWLG